MCSVFETKVGTGNATADGMVDKYIKEATELVEKLIAAYVQGYAFAEADWRRESPRSSDSRLH